MELKTLISQNYPSGLYLLDTSKSPDEVREITESFGFAFYHLSGREVRSKEDLFPTMKNLLGLPEDLGENWDAFYDMITGFTWQPANAQGYLMLYDDIEYFAENNRRDFYVALRHLQSAGADTDHNRKFYVLLRGSTILLPQEFIELDKVQV